MEELLVKCDACDGIGTLEPQLAPNQIPRLRASPRRDGRKVVLTDAGGTVVAAVRHEAAAGCIRRH